MNPTPCPHAHPAAPAAPPPTPQDHQFVLYSFSRRPSHPATWLLEEHVLGAPSAEAARDWVATVNARIMAVRDRWVWEG